MLYPKRRERKVLSASHDDVNVGEVRHQVRFGSEALYRVCGLDREFARVEVIRAPGLEAGRHFTFTRAAVALMQLVTAPDADPAEARPRAVRVARAPRAR
jgi:hypothetical protein